MASLNGNPIGAAEVLYDSTCPIQKIPVAELSKLYVLERFYGQGIGYGLLHESEKEVLNTGNHLLNLEVYMENHWAIAFYERQDYASIGTVDFPMETNTYKNLVMRKVLKK